MYPRIPVKSCLFSFAFTVVLFVTACGASVQSTLTPTPVPTLASLPTSTPLPTLTPLPEIDLDIELPEGNPESGFMKAIRYTCHGCHVNELHLSSGPRFAATAELPFILERGEIRIALPDYEGRAATNQQYMIESIFLPEVYIVPGEWKNPMPTSFRDLMTEQELADILAWIATLK